MTRMTSPIDALPAPARPGAGTAARGARTGVMIAGGVAAWASARLALVGGDAPDVAPLRAAVGWAGALGASESILLLAGYVAAAALVGSALAIAAGAGPRTGRVRIATLVALLATEYALLQLAGWHTGPWLQAGIWYHLATAALTAALVLERRRGAVRRSLHQPAPRRRRAAVVRSATRAKIGAAGAVAAALGCTPLAPRPAALAPLATSGSVAASTVALGGTWSGEYAGRRYRRSGPIEVQLASDDAARPTLRGRVRLGGVPRTRQVATFAPTPAERLAAGTDEIVIDSARVTASGLVLWLAPYMDSGCDCGLILTLRATVRGDTLAGTLLAETGSLMAGDRGRWRAVRQRR